MEMYKSVYDMCYLMFPESGNDLPVALGIQDGREEVEPGRIEGRQLLSFLH